MNAPQVYQTATKLPSIFCAGHAQENTAKAEDVWDVTNGKKMSIAAVFDGHGGKMAAQRCKNELVPTLKDDATCVVVDLNPSQRTYEPAVTAGCGSACVVS